MALATYSDLKSAIADWVERGDLTARIPDFISLAEAKLTRALDARTMETDVSLTATPGSRFIPLPANYRGWLGFWYVTSAGRSPDLDFVAPENMETSTVAGLPRFWTVDGSQVAFERPCDSAYSFVIRIMGPLGLSDAAPTNMILTNHPDVYLYGALCEVAPYLRDAELQTLFETKFASALFDAVNDELKDKGQAPLRTELSNIKPTHLFSMLTGQ